MKKLFMLATAAFLFSGIAFANDGGKGKGKCCKKGTEASCKKGSHSCCMHKEAAKS